MNTNHVAELLEMLIDHKCLWLEIEVNIRSMDDLLSLGVRSGIQPKDDQRLIDKLARLYIFLDVLAMKDPSFANTLLNMKNRMLEELKNQ